MHPIYLDACSTTRIDPRVAEVISRCLAAGFVNPASQHRAGQQARAHIDESLAVVRKALNIGSRDRVVVTSGGTESNNLAIFGLTSGTRPDSGHRPNIVISPVEHPSVMEPARSLALRGFDIRFLPVSRDGRVQTDSLKSVIDEQTALVALMLVNNETGVIQPVSEVAGFCLGRGIPLHCDAVQAIGKIAFDFRRLADEGVTSISIAPHKYHGPRGVGALIIAGQEPPLHPLILGGFQQLGMRPGTQDVALIAGLAEATQIAVSRLAEHAAGMESLRNDFEKQLVAALPDVVIHGSRASRAPHCSNVAFPGDGASVPAVDRQALLLACDAAGLAISTGSACASGSSEPSPALVAMGLPASEISSSVRVSFSHQVTPEDCQEACRRIINAVKQLRQQKRSRK